MTDAEKLAKLKAFLHRVNGYGYLELSQAKIEGEYRYFHIRARELLDELFPSPPSEPSAPDNLDF